MRQTRIQAAAVGMERKAGQSGAWAVGASVPSGGWVGVPLLPGKWRCEHGVSRGGTRRGAPPTALQALRG